MPSPEPTARAGLVLAGLVLVYTTGYLAWYGGTPLGRYPVLDAREIIELARQIAAGALAPEPFYRAPVYPALLSLIVEPGITDAQIALWARAFNALCHFASTALVWSSARAIWQTRAAATVAAGLFGLNPVVLHFAGDALDITLAMTLMLCGIRAAVAVPAATRARPALVATAAACLAAGTMTRPHLLPLVVWWPLLQLAGRTMPVSRGMLAAVAVLPAVCVFAGMGLVNYRHAGDFVVLPWQGAYNFWAANKPGAHGRFFEQSGVLQTYDEGLNPARLESERLYRQEHAGRSPVSYREAVAYWRARTIARIAADPWSWLRQMAGKIFYLCNNFEQYNNKTYVVHKQRSPWLVPNPINWALVAGLGAVGLACGWRVAALRVVGAAALVYAAGVLLFYVSDRFRLPLVPLLAIAAGGAGDARAQARTIGTRRFARAVAFGLLIAALSLVPLPRAEREATFGQDYLLLARAATQTGAHAEASGFARTAARYAADAPAVADMRCVTGFNAWLHARSRAATVVGADVAAQCRAAARFSEPAHRLLGIIVWQAGHRDDAWALWRRMLDDGSFERDNLLAALALTGGLRTADAAALAALDYARAGDGLVLALALSGDPRARAETARRFTPAETARQFASLRKVFARAD